MEQVESRLDKIERYYAAASPDVREEVDDILPWAEIFRFQNSNYFISFVRKFVQEESDKREKGARSDPLCRCADSACRIKRGELPDQCVPRRGPEELEPGAKVRVERLIHGPHDEVVITEAWNAYLDRYNDLMPDISRALSLLEDDVEQSSGLLGEAES